MKKLLSILIITLTVGFTAFAGNLKGAPSISGGIKFNNSSTELGVYANDGNWYNWIDWAGLESTPSVAIDFDYDWYSTNKPVYFGIGINSDIGSINSFGLGFKVGYYNDYINLFLNSGISYIIAELNATKHVNYRVDSYYDYSKVNSLGFNGIGYYFGFGLDIHPYGKPFFIRLTYSYEDCIKPDETVKTSQYTKKWSSSDVDGGTSYSNNSFSISVGWQFGRNKLLKD